MRGCESVIKCNVRVRVNQMCTAGGTPEVGHK